MRLAGKPEAQWRRETAAYLWLLTETCLPLEAEDAFAGALEWLDRIDRSRDRSIVEVPLPRTVEMFERMLEGDER